MPTFSYKARDQKSLPIFGTVNALDEITVAQNLKALGYSVITIDRENRTKIFLEGLLSGLSKRLKKSKKENIIFFTRQLQTMLRAGIPLVSALSSIAEQSSDMTLQIMIKSICKDIEGGMSLSESLIKYPDTFSDSYISMVKVGEAAGILDEVLDRLHHLNLQELEVSAKIRAAFAYPVILVSTAIVVVSFLLINILPKFISVFEVYGARLPLATRILLGVSFLISHLWYIILAGIIGLSAWFAKYRKSAKGRYQIDSYILKAPIAGRIYMELIISRFARTLGAMVRTGVPILEALAISEKTIPNVVIQKIIQKVRLAVEEGESLTGPFKAIGIFPPMVIEMVSAGEKTGRLDQMLIDIADFYDSETTYMIRSITTVLEPALLLAMGLIVAFIALSVLMPIFNLIKVFKH